MACHACMPELVEPRLMVFALLVYVSTSLDALTCTKIMFLWMHGQVHGYNIISKLDCVVFSK